MNRPRVKSTVHLAAKTAEEREANTKKGNIHALGLVKKSVHLMPNGSPALLPKRTGLVYIENEDGKLELMDNAFYSNLSMEVYDADGNNLMDSKMAPYNGKKWSVKFTLNDKDRFGVKQQFTGLFLAPLPWSEFGRINWEALEDAEQLEAEMAIRYGVLSGYDDPYLNSYATHGASTYCVYCCPGKKLQEIEPFCTWLGFTLVYDDQVDLNKYFDYSLTYDELHVVREKLWEILRDEKEPDEQEVDFEMPQMKQLCRYMKHSRDEARRLVGKGEMSDRYYEDIKNYTNNVATVNSAEWIQYKEDCKVGTEHRAHWNLRRYDSGMFPVCHMHILNYEIKLPNHIYHSPLWQFFKTRVCDHNVFNNDMFSYKKEMIDGETCNAVFNYHHGEKLSFQDACQAVCEDANSAITDMWELGKLMMKIYDNDPDLEKALWVSRVGAFGHVLFYNHGLQYHNGVIFDLVIHKDEWDSAVDKNAREQQRASA